MAYKNNFTRRAFVQASAVSAIGGQFALQSAAFAQQKGQRPSQSSEVKVLNPCNRVPLSFIIDDSTCLVNMAHFGIPQFAEAFPDNYKQDWKSLPREIPDSFVRKFGEWCAERGIKGKYSIVPYPACVGWVDRRMPGWSQKELVDSIKLVQELMMPNWDIHPEMVSHTFVIDTKTGRPYPERTPYFMENWRWTDGKSVDEIADYMTYALKILQNAGFYCEGITTPGGFGNRVLAELSQATLQSCRDVYKVDIPHYFRHLFTDDRSVAPRVEYASDLEGDDPQCVVSIIGCTGDWFGGWDGLTPGSADKCITEDLRGGRLPEVIDKGEPAILVCHWPGIYYNGQEIGFNIFREVVKRVHSRYNNLIWLKLSEIARYWAAKELTKIEKNGSKITLKAPFPQDYFTVQIPVSSNSTGLTLTAAGKPVSLKEVKSTLQLGGGKYYKDRDKIIVCFDMPKGISEIIL